MVMQGKTQGLYWFGLNVPTSNSNSRALALKFVVGVTNGRERERGSQVSGLRVCARARARVCVESGWSEFESLLRVYVCFSLL